MAKLFETIFGKASKSTQSTPTSFATLPQFGQDAFKQALERGTALSQDSSLFAPAGLRPEQLAALSSLTAGLDPTSPEAFQTGISTFSDPFEEQVVQNAIRDIQETGAGQLSDIGTFADAAGGFGGTRQALLESELQKNIQRNVGNISGSLRSQGFQSAADRTLADIARSQAVAPTLFGLGEFGREIETQQRQAPLQSVQFLQNLAKGLPVGGGGSSLSTGASKGIFSQLFPKGLGSGSLPIPGMG